LYPFEEPVNIAFDPKTQAPSKLIDYALTGRPVLSLPSGQFDTKILDQFLIGDYSARMDIGSLDRFNITNVAQQFTLLLNE